MTRRKGFFRKDRVSEQIRRDLAELISRELKDPRVGLISLTGVEVTPDYAHAKVYFSVLSDEGNLPAILEGLRQSAGFLRHELGRRIRIHTIPELQFIYDESLVRGVQLSRLIDEASALSATTPDD